MGNSGSKDLPKKSPLRKSYLQSPSYNLYINESSPRPSRPWPLVSSPMDKNYLSPYDAEVYQTHSPKPAWERPPPQSIPQETTTRPSTSSSNKSRNRGRSREESSSPESTGSPKTPTDSPTGYQCFPRYSLPPGEHKQEQLRMMMQIIDQNGEEQKQKDLNKRLVEQNKKKTLAERRNRRVPGALNPASLKT